MTGKVTGHRNGKRHQKPQVTEAMAVERGGGWPDRA